MPSRFAKAAYAEKLTVSYACYEHFIGGVFREYKFCTHKHEKGLYLMPAVHAYTFIGR